MILARNDFFFHLFGTIGYSQKPCDTPRSKEMGVLPSSGGLATVSHESSSRGPLSRSVSRGKPVCFRVPPGTASMGRKSFCENIERRILITIHDQAARRTNISNTIILNQFSDSYGTFIGAATALNDATKNTSAANNQSVNYLADANTVANASLTNVTINGDGIIQYESDCNNNTSAGDTSNSISGNNGNIANDGSFVNNNNTCNGGTDERALFMLTI